MTRYLPPNLFAIFQPRDAPPFIAPPDTLHAPPLARTHSHLAGVAAYLHKFSVDAAPSASTEKPKKVLSKEQRKQQRRLERHEAQRKWLLEAIPQWKPLENAAATTDAYKTLFIARLAYSIDEATLRREFETYGPIKSLRVVRDDKGQSRGYAFVEFEREKDMKVAYKEGESKRLGLKNARVLVDVERGRTVKDWRPRRLGGGLGHVRDDKAKKGGVLPPPLPPLFPPAAPPASSSSAAVKRESTDKERDRERERERERPRDDKERDRHRDERDRARPRDDKERDRPRDDKERERSDRHRDDKERDRHAHSSHREDKDRDRRREDRDRSDRPRDDKERTRDGKERERAHDDKDKERDRERDRERRSDRDKERDRHRDDKDKERKERGDRDKDRERSDRPRDDKARSDRSERKEPSERPERSERKRSREEDGGGEPATKRARSEDDGAVKTEPQPQQTALPEIKEEGKEEAKADVEPATTQ